MDLRQISVRYEQEQDRLLLRALSAGGSQAQSWLTRRLMLRLWPVLQQLLVEQGAFPLSPHATPTPEARRMLGESAREAALRQSELGRPYEEDQVSEQPLGSTPLLAVRVELNTLPGGRCRLGFADGQRRGFELELAGAEMLVLVHLLEQALRVSEWKVIREPAPQEAQAETPPRAVLLN